MDEAEGSSPSSSTCTEPSAGQRRLGFAFGGLVAAEGTFTTSRLRPDVKRLRLCTIDGCTEPRRAKGLCRRHYYAAYGR